MRGLAKGLLLLLLPALVIAGAELERAARGPLFYGPNQDPSYTYLAGSLQLARYGSTGFFHHPGLPTQVIGAAVLAGAHRLAGPPGTSSTLSWGDSLVHDVLTHPERYLRILQLAILAAVASALAAAGFVVASRGDAVAGLLLQTSPFLGALSLVSLSEISPDSVLVLAAVALSLAIWRFASTAPDDERVAAVAFGAIAAIALTSRISALPFALVPLLLLASWRGRAVFVATSAAGSCLALLLIAGQWRPFLDWILLQGRRSGSWGSEQRKISDLDLYFDGIALLYRNHEAFLAVFGLALGVWLWHRLGRQEVSDHRLFRRALGAVLLGQAVQVLVVSKNPAGRYLIPATALAGLDLALAWALLTGGTGWARRWPRAVLAGLLLVLPAALELPHHRGQLNRLRRGVEGRDLIAAEISRLPADCTVAEFFRASSLPYALQFGGRLRPWPFVDVLAELYPDELFYNHWRRGFQDYNKMMTAEEVAAKYPCLALHGHYRPELSSLVIQRTPVETLYAVPSVDAVVNSDAAAQ